MCLSELFYCKIRTFNDGTCARSPSAAVCGGRPPSPEHGCTSVVNRRFLMVLRAAENTPSWVSHITLVISGLWILDKAFAKWRSHACGMSMFTEEPGRGGTHGHICPHQTRSGGDVYQFRSRRVAPLVHSSCWFPLTGPGSVSPRHYLQWWNLFMSHRCKCLFLMNVGRVFNGLEKRHAQAGAARR